MSCVPELFRYGIVRQSKFIRNEHHRIIVVLVKQSIPIKRLSISVSLSLYRLFYKERKPRTRFAKSGDKIVFSVLLKEGEERQASVDAERWECEKLCFYRIYQSCCCRWSCFFVGRFPARFSQTDNGRACADAVVFGKPNRIESDRIASHRIESNLVRFGVSRIDKEKMQIT